MKKVLITGGNSGLGKSLVNKYLDNGYMVYATYNKNADFDKIENVNYLKLDLNNRESIDDLVNSIPNIDVLINNAGIAMDDLLENKSYDSILEVISTNLVGPLYLSKEVGLKKMDKGHIIFVSSDCAFKGNYPEGIDYDASKIGLTKVVEDLAISFSPNIYVNGIAPGWIDTPMNNDMSDTFKNNEINKILLNRFALPDEIANSIYFLTSSDSSYINGTTIVVNGGVK